MENVKVTTLELTAENVVRIFTDCCFKNEEIKEERHL
jgi:hypothetical protein